MQRKRVAILALLAIAGTAAVWGGVRGAGIPESRLAQQAPRNLEQTDVDVELVIAVDVSYSMDPDEQALQREGYILGLTSSEFLNALKQGIHGKVAITYFEWAGVQDQRIVVPWRIIDSPATARAVADEIAAAPLRRAYRTSISGALLFGAPLFQTSGHRGIRRVIDVSGDGANNQGPPVTVIRDQVLEQGPDCWRRRRKRRSPAGCHDDPTFGTAAPRTATRGDRGAVTAQQQSHRRPRARAIDNPPRDDDTLVLHAGPLEIGNGHLPMDPLLAGR